MCIKSLIAGEQRLGETKVKIHWRQFGTPIGKQFSAWRKWEEGAAWQEEALHDSVSNSLLSVFH